MQKKILQKILYVEDEPDIVTIAHIALVDVGGFEVKHCSTGEEVLKIAPQFKPDLFLLDMMLPKMNGIDILHALRKLPEFTKTPVIFITAKIQPKEVAHYEELGALGVIAKPFDPMQLATLIKNYWEKYAG